MYIVEGLINVPKRELSFILHDNAIDIVLGLDLVLRYPRLVAIEEGAEPHPVAGARILPELFEGIINYSHTHLFDKVQIKVKVVDGVQDR